MTCAPCPDQSTLSVDMGSPGEVMPSFDVMPNYLRTVRAAFRLSEAILVLLVFLPWGQTITAASDYVWQQPQAVVTTVGDLQWAPRPFQFETGATVRYIDFATGNDNNSGQTKAAPWKRHPWDSAATGNARNGRGTHTYVFKRGVVYRGKLTGSDAGTVAQPIRLTSDPTWGTG